MVIKQISLEHKGGFYFYRVHQGKVNKLVNGFSSLHNYLEEMFTNCPHFYFQYGPRSSSLKFRLNLDVKRVTGHEVSSLAKYGLEEEQGSAHMKVQKFMLEKDNKTIAVEVPLWIEPSEFQNIKGIFQAKDPLTGHIDVLRIEDQKIWIWDYKPNAHKEIYAGTQVFFYALMLSQRTGIPLDFFRCGYFDSNAAFVFKPAIKEGNKNKGIFEFI